MCVLFLEQEQRPKGLCISWYCLGMKGCTKRVPVLLRALFLFYAGFAAYCLGLTCTVPQGQFTFTQLQKLARHGVILEDTQVTHPLLGGRAFCDLSRAVEALSNPAQHANVRLHAAYRLFSMMSVLRVLRL